MLFYKLEAFVVQSSEENICDMDRRAAMRANRVIATKTEEFNTKLNGASIFETEMFDDLLTACIVIESKKNTIKIMESYCKHIGINVTDITCEEITISDFKNMVARAEHQGFVKDSDEVFEEYRLDRLSPRGFRGADFGENILNILSREKIAKMAQKNLVGETFLPELDRIYAGKVGEAKGHPVHYIVRTDDHDIRNGTYQSLLCALYDNHRIDSKRYAYIDFRPGDMNVSGITYESLYECARGGCIVVRFYGDDCTEDEYSSGEAQMLEMIADNMKRFRNSVLTIVCFERGSTRARDTLMNYLGNLSVVEISEELAKGDRAKAYLRLLAKEHNVKADTKLFSKLEEDKSYLSNDLQEIFDDWYDDNLKKTVFPQYKECISARVESAKERHKGSAYDELQEMIGLQEAKSVIDKALNFYKMQKLFSDQNISNEKPALNFLFTGPAGSAKTSVAKLYARILKENGILSKGNLYMESRSTLCAKYVGHTAQNIKAKFEEARGSVLFIDECYSLIDNHNGGYGREAIDEIVNQLDNYKGEICVILAGYENPMLEFIKQNPGLSSRVPFQVHFDNYNTEELCAIADLMRNHLGLKFGEGVDTKLAEIFDKARNFEDFGNGRYVRNLFDLSRMNQASRILKSDIGNIGKEQLCLLTVDDIEAPVIKEPKKVSVPIGFCA